MDYMILMNIETKYPKVTEKIQELNNIVKKQKKNKERQVQEDFKVKKRKEKGPKV